MVQRTIDQRQLHKSIAVEESDDSSEDEESVEEVKEIVEEPARTEWEIYQDICVQNRFTRARNESQESLQEDEDACDINLSNMYRENSTDKPPSVHNDQDQSVEDMIRHLKMKSPSLHLESAMEKKNSIVNDNSTETEIFMVKDESQESEDLTQDTLDVIDKLMKSFEKESNEKLDVAQTIN